MSFHISLASTRRIMTWKNGGGSTVEIAVWPENADLSNFDWRISMATVDRDGPFSQFPETDRTLCVLNGEGLVLRGLSSTPTTVTPIGEPAVFPGDARCIARSSDLP